MEGTFSQPIVERFLVQGPLYDVPEAFAGWAGDAVGAVELWVVVEDS